MFNLQNYEKFNIKNGLLSGMVVAVALVPEAIAFSFIAGVSPLVGMYTAFILGLITSLLGGKPGMISGATGAVAVVFVGLGLAVAKLYPELSGEALSVMILHYILLTTIFAGAFQVLVGVLKMGKFIRLVPQPAMFGFVNGLAIVIALAQLKFFRASDHESLESWSEILSHSLSENYWMYIITVITMAIMYFMPKFTKVIPSGLAAIVALTIIVYLGGIDTKTVRDLADIEGAFPTFVMPNLSLLNWESMFIILPYAILVAMVGLIESLLTLSVLDEMSGTRGRGNKECIAQGCGNMTSGFFGGMAGCAMIGQSIINYTSGGLGRVSSSTASILLIIFVVSLSDLIGTIPVAVLVGIMFMVSIGTFEFSSISRIKYMPRADAFVLVLVTIITVFFDLAVAVIAGIIVSALVFAWQHAKIHANSHIEDDGTKVYDVDGPLFFGSVTSFQEQFEVADDPDKIVLDFKDARVMDISGVEAIDMITKKYRESGKTLSIRHLSKDCKGLLKEAGPFCTYAEDDPTYKIATDKKG
ncbi:MAG TPA: SulP family inorganic anion transporter [Campylobacterales bacterium]|nr:SulP family inorganic anion transporter [Campylobacterales bacterium]